MTRKKWRKKMVAMVCRVNEMTGHKTTGETLRYYRDLTLKDVPAMHSYAESWACMEPVRKHVGM